MIRQKALMLSALTVTLFLPVIPSNAETIQYQYDNMGRLTQAAYGNGVVVKYSYDKMGNRLQQTVTVGTTLAPAATSSQGDEDRAEATNDATLDEQPESDTLPNE